MKSGWQLEQTVYRAGRALATRRPPPKQRRAQTGRSIPKPIPAPKTLKFNTV